MKGFGEALRDRAEALGISSREVARRCGLEYGRYGNYVANKREPDLATLVKIARVLGTSPNSLLNFGADDAVPPPDMARLLSAFNGLDAEGRELAAALVEMLAERLAQNRAPRADLALAAPAEAVAPPAPAALTPPKKRRRRKSDNQEG